MLQLDFHDEHLVSAARTVLGITLPAPACATSGDDLLILRLAQDACLMVVPQNGQYHWIPRLRARLSGWPIAIVDVSSGYATFGLSGPAAPELLYRGCSTPLDPPAVQAGSCITTKVGKITAIINRTSDSPEFDLHVARGLALSFWTWLIDAGSACGLAIAACGASDR